ncbi:S8 family serine peptidase [Fervidibacillus halotolerans]|uniref:S8 family serine peptidase n=1 Tax=Fervidibacillus halotolerans TaxID=2980027 RepID=A0A9E8LYJ2_9BACI|nr:S8 family serine peptidase [Fervidibacillus halotolerans]WAA12133.1 S8 family serine peptidase [Fervidibacillus halotolerans]
MRKVKRIFLLVVIFALTFQSVAFGMGMATQSSTSSQGRISVPKIAVEKPEIKLSEKLEETKDPEEKIRIIVELETEPAIKEATKKGVLYKELSKSVRENLESAVEKEQTTVTKSIRSVVPDAQILEQFTTVFNGISMEVKVKDVEKIEEVSGVKAVYESVEYEQPEETPTMVTSKDLIEARQVWEDYGYDGEGMIVGIIDTGIDYTHKDMVLTNPENASLTEDDVNGLLSDGTIGAGKYFTSKVPFGYNYMDKNNEIRDLGPNASMHGMHVAGTVGANGDEENGGIKGVAPEAQLLALKVFGNDPLFGSTYDDIYVKAIDDAIKLNADVLNLSLGSPAGFVDENSPSQQAIKNATENGILVSISAGNENMYGDGYFYPYASNPDYGLVGSPSVANESLSVASFENDMITTNKLEYAIADEESGSAPFLNANDKELTVGESIELVYAGLGKPEDFEGKDFEGKFALIQRGELAFVDKTLNAQAAGASGAIIYNNTDGIVNMATDASIVIPQLFMLKSDGDKLAAALQEGKTVTVTFTDETMMVPSDTAGLMSDFTSWGLTPNLEFKPEITAPGGNIYSTLNDDQYGMMSGTSMAAPHVSGGSALVMEKVKEDFGLTGSALVEMTKQLLMNTAKPVEFDGAHVSPRRQGAGLMQLHAALSTPAIVTDVETGEANVALKEITDNVVTFQLKVDNLSDEDLTYEVTGTAQTDTPVNAGVYISAPNLFGALELSDTVTVNGEATTTIEVPANGSTTFDVTIDVTDWNDGLIDYFENGYWLDGFVTLTDPTDTNPELTVPFVGFKGDWDAAPIFDYYAWDPMTYWGITFLVDDLGYIINGGVFEEDFNPERFAFSPNDDGEFDMAVPIFSLFRNVKELKVSVLDEEGNTLRTIRTEKNYRKTYSNITSSPYVYDNDFGWDGYIDGELAPEGDYILEVSGVIDFEGAEWQSIQFPVKVDYTAPEATVEYDFDTNTVSISDVVDEVSGADYWEVYVNGYYYDYYPMTETEVQLEGIEGKDQITVVVWDTALNHSEYNFTIPGEDEADSPVIYVNSPNHYDGFSDSEVYVYGSVEDDSNIASLTINGEEPDYFDGEYFDHVLTLEDGVQDVVVKAVDEHGNESQIVRTVLVDTKDPSIEVGLFPTLTDKDKITVPVTVQDNFDEIRLYVNGDEKYVHELSVPLDMVAFNETIDLELDLVDGTNTLTLEVSDVVGNQTEQVIEIEKLETAENAVVADEVSIIEQSEDQDVDQVVVVVPELTEQVSEMNVIVSQRALKAVSDSGKTLVVKSGELETEFGNSVISGLQTSEIVTFSLALATDTDVETDGSVVSDVYEFSVVSETDDVQTEVNEFEEPVKVTVPITAELTDSRKASAYYVSEDGLQYAGGKYDEGTFKFSTNHFSKFVIIERDQSFDDVKDHWAKDVVEVLASRMITNGQSETKFNPEGKVTRAEFAVLLARALKLPTESYEGIFTDVSEDFDWAYPGIEAAYRAGIVKGVSEEEFAPNAEITREQMVVMIIRAIEYANAELLEDLETGSSFADEEQISSYALENIKQALSLGLINGRGENKFAPKETATRAEAATMVYRMLDVLDEL